MQLLRFPLFLLVFVFTATSAVFAQTKPSHPPVQNVGSVTGKLVDSKNTPVSYATVTLLRTDSSVINGDLTKDDGSFNIAPTGIGSFLLKIESIGAITKIVAIENTAAAPDKNVGNIKVTQSSNTLNEVSVVGEKPIMELKVDKKVFNVEKNTTTAGGSATDVLQNVPAVSVDADGNVSLRGKTDVTILIDGKPATMLGSDVASALQSLPAGSIESVEVITNPSAKYDAQGTSGIINIVTKKDGRFGINGNVTLGAGTRDKYNGNFGLNIRKGKWSVFLNSSGRINNTYNNVTTDRQDNKPTAGNLQSYHTYEHVPRDFGGLFNTIGASYDPDKYNSITLTENINRMGFSFKDYSDYYTYRHPGYHPEDTLTHLNKYTDFQVNLFSISSALDYKHKFKKKDEELSIDATYATTDFNRHQHYITAKYPITTLPYYPTIQNAIANGGNQSFNAWADYVDPLFTKNGKLGLGFKSQLFWFDSKDLDPTVTAAGSPVKTDSSLIISYNYSQQVHAAYANWSDQVGKFSYQAGLRFEDAIYDAHGLVAAGDTLHPNALRDAQYHNSFINLFPSGFISYQLKNQQSIYLNYSYRTNRPGFMQLLPYLDLSNPGTINKGNPDLKPEFINNIEFSYSKNDNKGNNFIFSTYYAYTKHLIEKVTVELSDQDALTYGVVPKTLFSQPVNIESGTTYGLEGTGHLQILPIWDATVNLNFFENVLVAGPDVDTSIKNNSGFTWFGKVNTNLKLPKNFSFQVNVNYESPKIVTQGTLKETYWVDVALRKNLWKNKATIILNCSDIFNTHIFVTNYDQNSDYNQLNTRVKETRIVNLTFTYRFGKSNTGKPGAPGGKQAQKPTDTKKIEKPSEEDRQKNMKEGDDNDQGGGGGNQGGGRGGR